MIQYYHHLQPVILESGAQLPRLTIAYSTYGHLNAARDNVIWVCHALTANSRVDEWWPGLAGPGCPLDTDRYFVICANMLGSCYGTTGPAEPDPEKGSPYGLEFPLITVRDMVMAHQLLADALGIGSIRLVIGGSMGGQQALEWAATEPDRFDQLCVLASNARHSPWGIAFNESQRMAMRADQSLGTPSPEAGRRGLEAARAIAMLSYRHYRTYGDSQTETEGGKLDDYRASSYQRYQGFKLWKRFDPVAYYGLSRSMDSHDLGRNRGGVEQALGRIGARSLIIGIDTDVLFPLEEQALLARHIPDARLEVIHSDYGHDGFLTETAMVGRLLAGFMSPGQWTGDGERPVLNAQLAGRELAVPGTESI